MERLRAEDIPDAPGAAGPYSLGVKTRGGLYYTSGQVALTAEGKLLQGTIEEETRQVMRNLQAVLGGAALDFSHVVKSNIYLTDVGMFGRVNAIYAESFEDGKYPARACVGVAALPLGANVEIEMVAEFPAN